MMKKILCLSLLVGVFAIINNLPSAAAFPEEEHLLVKREDAAPEDAGDSEPPSEDGESDEGADGGEGEAEPEDATTEGDAPPPPEEEPQEGEGEGETEEPLP